MEEDKKKLFEYLREIFKLKTRVVTDYNKYEKNIDIDSFKNTYKDFAYIHGFTNNISENDEYFVLKYIVDEFEYPQVPNEIKDYLDITENGMELKKDDNIPENIQNLFKNYNNDYNDVLKKNSIIRKYNELYEYFYNLHKKITDFEEKIEVVLCKGLLIYKNDEILKNPLRRHVFEAPLNIEINQSTNTIFLKMDRENKCNLECNFLSSLKGFRLKNQNAIYDLKEQIIDKYVENEIIDFDSLYIDYLNNAYFKTEYVKDGFYTEFEKDKCYIFNKDAIVVRKKQPTIWLDDINTILKHIEENGELKLDNKIVDLILEKDEENLKKLLESEKEDFRILFPLPSNDEQFKVVSQTQNSNIVLVQGPPGTGKSHTITNMISTYVANGKKVLVTSEKSKALEVVKEKLPDQIKDLSMTLLNDTNTDKELVKSVQCVLEKYKEKAFLDEYKDRINKIENKLDETITKYQKNYEEIIDILSNNVINNKEEINKLVKIELKDYKLVDIAKYLEKNRNQDIISDKNNFNNLNFDKDLLYKINPIAEELNQNKRYVFDREFDLPRDLNFEELIETIQKVNSIEQSLIDRSIKDCINERNVAKYDIGLILDNLNKILKIEKLYSKAFIKTNCNYTPRIKNVENIIKDCSDSKEFLEKIEALCMSNDISYDIKKIFDYSKALNLINEKFIGDGRISIFEKLQLRKELELISEITINNEKYAFEKINNETLNLLINKFKYDIKIRKIMDDINKVLGESSLFDNILYSEFSRKIDEIINVLSTFVNYSNIIEDIKVALNDIFKGNKEVEKLIANEDFENIVSCVKEILDYEKFISYIDEFNDSEKELKNKTLKNRDIFDNLINAFSNKNLEEYNDELDRIKKIYNLTDSLNDLKANYKEEFDKYISFIKDFISKDSEQRLEIIKKFDLYYEYYKLKMFLYYKELKNSKFDELLKENTKLQKEEKELIVKLIAEKSWYEQINKMTNTTCRALSEWSTLKTKLGKGTGKRANLIRKQMQEKMLEAKEAFPIWIMPAERVIEQYPFNPSSQFDVIIMDESSQSSILSITALLRGKKCVIVGDDKQISPIEVGINIEDLNALQYEYLRNTRLGVEFEMDTSLYDVTQNVCGSRKVVLKEHFRCLPEIIQFSNENFYGNQINCLKVRGKENTIETPIKTVFVPDAKVKRVSGSNMINAMEIKSIIDILKNIDSDISYENKTIGIIALQNSTAHINGIISEIWKNFNEEFIKKRKLKIGNAYDFQGDERDVIILSMVTSKVQEDGEINPVTAFTKKEYERSFNVAASRAKEQSILVYSIKSEELSPKCLRYKLLNYYLNYSSENNKNKDNEIIFNTDFEKDLYTDLVNKNINVKTKFKIGKYILDFIIENNDGKKIAIECDGDKNSDIKEFEEELKKQNVLERCGWTFIRCRASQYYNNPLKTLNEIVDKISELLKEENLGIKENRIFSEKMNQIINISPNENLSNDNNIEKINKMKDISNIINLTNLYIEDSNQE